MTLLGALLFAVHIVFVSKFAKKHDVLALTVFQFLTEGTLGCLGGRGFRGPAPAFGHHSHPGGEHGVSGGVRAISE